MFRPYMAIIRFCQLRFRNPLHAIYIAKPQLTKPDDGHIRPKHVVLLQILTIYIFYITYELCV